MEIIYWTLSLSISAGILSLVGAFIYCVYAAVVEVHHETKLDRSVREAKNQAALREIEGDTTSH